MHMIHRVRWRSVKYCGLYFHLPCKGLEFDSRWCQHYWVILEKWLVHPIAIVKFLTSTPTVRHLELHYLNHRKIPSSRGTLKPSQCITDSSCDLWQSVCQEKGSYPWLFSTCPNQFLDLNICSVVILTPKYGKRLYVRRRTQGFQVLSVTTSLQFMNIVCVWGGGGGVGVGVCVTCVCCALAWFVFSYGYDNAHFFKLIACYCGSLLNR